MPATRHWWALAGILAAAAVLRLYQLDSQLWLDEVAALSNSIRRPVVDIVTVWPGLTSHVFYEIWAHVSLDILGESALAIRLPAAVFGVAGVWAIYLLAAREFARWHALTIAAFLAVSYHHIFYSQDARSYTALILFFLIASYLFVGFRGTSRITPATGLAYAGAIALGTYSNLFGIFVLTAHVPIVIIGWLRERRNGSKTHFPVRAYFAYAALSGLLILLLYAPFVGSILAYTRTNTQTPDAGPRASGELLLEVMAGLNAAFGGPVGITVVCVVGFAGLVFWYRRSPFLLSTLLGPIVVQALVVVPLGIGIHPRYFAVALPVIILLGGGGFVLATHWLTLAVALPRRQALEAVLLALGVLASAVPLMRYYAVPKQDFVGAMRVVSTLEQPGDLPVGVYLAGHVIQGYYHADYRVADRLEDLLSAEQSGRRLLLVTTLEPLLAAKDRALYQHIRQNYQVVKTLPSTVGDGEMRIYLSLTAAASPVPTAAW